MAWNMGLLWIALGLVFVCCLVWAMAAMTQDPSWQIMAPMITAYIIVLTLIGGAMFVLFQFLWRR